MFDNTDGVAMNVHKRLTLTNVNWEHWTGDFEGRRYAIIAYTRRDFFELRRDDATYVMGLFKGAFSPSVLSYAFMSRGVQRLHCKSKHIEFGGEGSPRTGMAKTNFDLSYFQDFHCGEMPKSSENIVPIPADPQQTQA